MTKSYEMPRLENLGSIVSVTARLGASSQDDTGYFDGIEVPGFGSRDTCEVDAGSGAPLNPNCPL